MPTKPKISITESHEIMALYFKLTGQKIDSPQKILIVHKILTDYVKAKNKSS